MSTSDKINLISAGAQVAVAIVAIVAIWISFRQNKKQMAASEKQLNAQIKASETQVREQIMENRRLATEERQHQSRPIVAPEREITHNTITNFDLHTRTASEDIYTSEGRINWSWQHPIRIKLHNMGSGPAFNLHCILFGPDNTTQSQFVSWDNDPIEEKSSMDVDLVHISDLGLFYSDKMNDRHILFDKSLDSPTNPWLSRIARLTLTYHDLSGEKYVSIFHYTIEHRWIHLATEEIVGNPPLDLKELNAQRKQGPKQSAPLAITAQGS